MDTFSRGRNDHGLYIYSVNVTPLQGAITITLIFNKESLSPPLRIDRGGFFLPFYRFDNDVTIF